MAGFHWTVCSRHYHISTESPSKQMQMVVLRRLVSDHWTSYPPKPLKTRRSSELPLEAVGRLLLGGLDQHRDTRQSGHEEEKRCAKHVVQKQCWQSMDLVQKDTMTLQQVAVQDNHRKLTTSNCCWTYGACAHSCNICKHNQALDALYCKRKDEEMTKNV